eukprot:gene9845-18423_t
MSDFSPTVRPVPRSVPEVPFPSGAEMNALFSKINESNKKPVILSLVPEFSEQFVLKSRRIPTLPALYDYENLKLTYPELLQKCCEVEVKLSDSDIKLIECDTRDQSNGTAFFKHRAGRVGASICYSVAHTNPAQPSISLIKSICYPQLFRVNSKAINHGIKNESKAIEAYNTVMSANHDNFAIEKCGVFIYKKHPWMHATPDFLCTCSCCGNGCGEVKCSYPSDDSDFASYINRKSSCLEKVDDSFRLRRKMQVQGSTLNCSNPTCLIKEFHYACLRISDPVERSGTALTVVCYLNSNARKVGKYQKKPV